MSPIEKGSENQLSFEKKIKKFEEYIRYMDPGMDLPRDKSNLIDEDGNHWHYIWVIRDKEKIPCFLGFTSKDLKPPTVFSRIPVDITNALNLCYMLWGGSENQELIEVMSKEMTRFGVH